MFKLVIALAATAEGVKINKYEYNTHYDYVGPMRKEDGLKVNEESLNSEMNKFSKTLAEYHYDNAH